MPDTNPIPRRVQLVRHGSEQAIHLPRDLELPGDTALVHVEEGRLVIEPAPSLSLVELLDTWEPLPPEDRMPDIPRPPPEPMDW